MGVCIDCLVGGEGPVSCEVMGEPFNNHSVMQRPVICSEMKDPKLYLEFCLPHDSLSHVLIVYLQVTRHLIKSVTGKTFILHKACEQPVSKHKNCTGHYYSAAFDELIMPPILSTYFLFYLRQQQTFLYENMNTAPY